MKPSLLITGAGGFVGRHLLEKIDYTQYHKVYCLTRKMENVSIPLEMRRSTQLEIVEADLSDVDSYQWRIQQRGPRARKAGRASKIKPPRHTPPSSRPGSPMHIAIDKKSSFVRAINCIRSSFKAMKLMVCFKNSLYMLTGLKESNITGIN